MSSSTIPVTQRSNQPESALPFAPTQLALTQASNEEERNHVEFLQLAGKVCNVMWFLAANYQRPDMCPDGIPEGLQPEETGFPSRFVEFAFRPLDAPARFEVRGLCLKRAVRTGCSWAQTYHERVQDWLIRFMRCATPMQPATLQVVFSLLRLPGKFSLPPNFRNADQIPSDPVGSIVVPGNRRRVLGEVTRALNGCIMPPDAMEGTIMVSLIIEAFPASYNFGGVRQPLTAREEMSLLAIEANLRAGSRNPSSYTSFQINLIRASVIFEEEYNAFEQVADRFLQNCNQIREGISPHNRMVEVSGRYRWARPLETRRTWFEVQQEQVQRCLSLLMTSTPILFHSVQEQGALFSPLNIRRINIENGVANYLPLEIAQVVGEYLSCDLADNPLFQPVSTMAVPATRQEQQRLTEEILAAFEAYENSFRLYRPIQEMEMNLTISMANLENREL